MPKKLLKYLKEPFRDATRSNLTVFQTFTEDIHSEFMTLFETTDSKAFMKVNTLFGQVSSLPFTEAKSRDNTPSFRAAAAQLFWTQLVYYQILQTKAFQLELDPLTHITARSDLDRLFTNALDVTKEEIFTFCVIDALKTDHYTIELINLVLKLIYQLELIEIQQDLLGYSLQRLFPSEYRKTTAAFYTSLPAAMLLANLAICSPTEAILDPACGSGALLVASLRRRKQLDPTISDNNLVQNTFGLDVSPLACLLASVNIKMQAPSIVPGHTNIILTDAFKANRTKTLGDYLGSRSNKDEKRVKLPLFDVLLANPPFTQGDRLESGYKDHLFGWFRERGYSTHELIDKKHLGLHGYFLLSASQYLGSKGTFAFILPYSTLYAESTEPVIRYLFDKFGIEFLIKSGVEPAFSDSTFEEIMMIGNGKYLGPIKIVILQEALAEKTPDAVDYLSLSIRQASVEGDYGSFRLFSVEKTDFIKQRWTVFFRSQRFVRLWRTILEKTQSITRYGEVIRGNRVAPIRIFGLPNKEWIISSITRAHVEIKRIDDKAQFKFERQDLFQSMKRYNEMAKYPALVPDGHPNTFYIKSRTNKVYNSWLKQNKVSNSDTLLYPPIHRLTHLAIPQKIGLETTKTLAFYSPRSLHVGDGFMSIKMDSEQSFWYFCYLTSRFGLFNVLVLMRTISGSYGQILGPDMQFFRYPDFSVLSSSKKKVLRGLVVQVSQIPVNEKPTFLETLQAIQEDSTHPLYQIDLIIAEVLGLDSKIVRTLHSVLIEELSHHKSITPPLI